MTRAPQDIMGFDIDYHRKIIEEYSDLIEKYAIFSYQGFLVKYNIESKYSFGYEYCKVYFKDLINMIMFLVKHKDQCILKDDKNE